MAAIAVLARPGSARRFLVLVAVQSIELYARLPWIDNLQMLTLLLGVAMLAALASAAMRQRAFPGGAGWLAELEPVVRLATVCVYCLTFWHKLNADFLAPDTSCGVAIYDLMRSQAWMPGELLPEGREMAPILIVTALAFEAAIPLLLIFARTARAGIAAGVAFHYVLGLARFYEFSILAVALLFLFAPPAYADALAAWWRSRPRRRLVLAVAAIGAALLALAAVQIVASWSSAASLRRTVRFGGHLLLAYGWWLSAVPLALGLRALWRLAPLSPAPRPRFLPARRWLLVAPLLVLLNGLSPYLGFKTENSYAMYSNLSTEGGRTNHLVLPAPFRLAGYQERLVRILESTDESLARAARRELLVPQFELRRLLHAERSSATAPLDIVYERDGAVFRVPPVGADPALAEPPSYWERKLLSFRSIHPGRAPCGH